MFEEKVSLTVFDSLLLSTDNEFAGHIRVSLLLIDVLLAGITISVIATDKQARIKNATTMPKNDITPKITRCGIIAPGIMIRLMVPS